MAVGASAGQTVSSGKGVLRVSDDAVLRLAEVAYEHFFHEIYGDNWTQETDPFPKLDLKIRLAWVAAVAAVAADLELEGVLDRIRDNYK